MARVYVYCAHETRHCSNTQAEQMHRRALRRADAFKQAHAADDDGGANAGGVETYAFLPQVLLGCVLLRRCHLLKLCQVIVFGKESRSTAYEHAQPAVVCPVCSECGAATDLYVSASLSRADAAAEQPEGLATTRS